MKNAVIMQARVGSSRLHAKVLKKLADKTVLEHDIERVCQAKKVDEIIIATTTNPEDIAIADVAEKSGAKVFRGSQNDVLDRYYKAAKKFGVDNIIRITSDCPVIDPYIIDEMITCYENENFDIITNVPNELGEMSYPRGLDVEIFPFVWLEKAWKEATDSYDREHVCPYIYDHAQSIYYYKFKENYSQYRWTLDTEQDWLLIQNIYEHFYDGEHNFYFSDIIEYMKMNPDIAKINANVIQKVKPTK